jgi:hypothetical protein
VDWNTSKQALRQKRNLFLFSRKHRRAALHYNKNRIQAYYKTIFKTSDMRVSLGLKDLSQQATEFLICMIRSWSSSLRFTLYFCISESARYRTPVGAFGIIFSIAIVFLIVQRAQAKPDNIKMINLIRKGPLPLRQVPQNSSQEVYKTINGKSQQSLPTQV